MGIVNLGNTCYINSVIQAIINAPKTRKYFYEHDTDVTNRDIVRAISKTAHIVHDLKKVSRPKGLMATLEKHMGGQLDIRCQNDANEFFSLLIDKLDAQQPNIPCVPSKSKRNRMNELADAAWNNNSEWFYGQFIQQVACSQCKKFSHSAESFLTIDLPVSHNDMSAILKDCFDKDIVTGFQCAKCNQTGDGEKVLRLWRLPTLLVFSVKRFDSMMNKIHTELTTVPFEIDLSSLVINPIYTKDQGIYQLSSIVCHVGNAYRGHYFCLCRSLSDDKWYKKDDENVEEISSDEVNKLSRTFYMFFYESK